ncbi:MAG: hypothetical protein NTZ80_01880 [Patescibacteria group bacterium]|nr:hypothetical protein [Patescibacteria group bacterium]
MRNLKLSFQKPISENAKGQESAEAMREIYRGIWADRLEDGQELPIGGSLFNKELTIKLELDFMAFDEQLESFTEGNIKKVYEQSEESVKKWLKQIGSDIDPYTYFLCYQVQQKTHELLEIDPNTPPNLFERQKMYRGQKPPKLSELKGKTYCAERAALGQYLLQKAGAESAYVSGIAMKDVKDTGEFPEDHSFIVLKHPTEPESTLIFDIAKPHSQNNVPRVLKTDVPFTYELLKNKKELLVGATEVLPGGRFWFGVGEPVAGQHEAIEKTEGLK